MKTKTFRVLRTDISRFVTDPPKGVKVWELAVFIPGEASYAASLNPSTATLPYGYDIYYTDGRGFDAVLEKLYSDLASGQGDEFLYTALVRNPENDPRISAPIEIEVDEDEGENELWNRAVEEARANPPEFPAAIEGQA